MSASISQTSLQDQQDYALQGTGGSDQEIKLLEEAVQELLSALQSGGSQESGQGVSQGSGGYDGEGEGSLSGASQPSEGSTTPDSLQSLGGSGSTQSLEAAVQDLLSALEQQNASQGGSGSGSGTSSEAQSLEQVAQQLLSALGQGQDSTATTPSTSGTASDSGDTGSTIDPNVTLANDYNNVMQQVSADGNSAQNVQQAVQQYMQDAQASGSALTPDVQNAMNNIASSLQDGTYSQQGSQGALEGAAEQDGMVGTESPSIAGQAGDAAQAAGEFDPSTNQDGALGANAAILESEIANGNAQGGQQITNNATALAKEAANQAQTDAAAGNTTAAAQDTALATAAQNIANSTGDGTYSGSASLQALEAALPDPSNTLAQQNAASAA